MHSLHDRGRRVEVHKMPASMDHTLLAPRRELSQHALEFQTTTRHRLEDRSERRTDVHLAGGQDDQGDIPEGQITMQGPGELSRACWNRLDFQRGGPVNLGSRIRFR